MNIEKGLEQLGLDRYEIRVYLAALQLGTASVQKVAQKAVIKRTTAYGILEKLAQRGFVSFAIKNNRRLCVAENPSRISALLEEKSQAIEQEKEKARELIPYLKSIHNITPEKPLIRFYEGRPGLIEIFESSLGCKNKETLVMSPVREVLEVLGDPYIRSYLSRRVKRKIKNRTVRVKSQEVEDRFYQRHKEHLREMRYAPSWFDFKPTVIIFDDKVAVLSSKKEKFGFIVQSQEFADFQRRFFEFLWKNSYQP